jgi:hypothetical protein
MVKTMFFRGLVYLERIPEAREAYQNARKLDPNFPLIPIKLGALELFGNTNGTEHAYQSEQREKAIALIVQGSDVYRRYLYLESVTNSETQKTNSHGRTTD